MGLHQPDWLSAPWPDAWQEGQGRWETTVWDDRGRTIKERMEKSERRKWIQLTHCLFFPGNKKRCWKKRWAVNERREVEMKRVGERWDARGEKKKGFSIRLLTLKAEKWVNHRLSKRMQSLSLSRCFLLSYPYHRWQIWLISVPPFGAVNLVIYVIWHYKTGSRDKQCPCSPLLRTHTHTNSLRQHGAAQSLPSHPVSSETLFIFDHLKL